MKPHVCVGCGKEVLPRNAVSERLVLRKGEDTRLIERTLKWWCLDCAFTRRDEIKTMAGDGYQGVLL